MSEDTAEITVAGGGVIGVAVALAVAQAGRTVRLLDPDPDQPSASSVAAGLIAPVGEAVYDADAAPHHAVLAAAAALWPDFAARHGIALRTEGTLLHGVTEAAVRRFDPAAQAQGDGAIRIGDAAVGDAAMALATLKARLIALGGRIAHRALGPDDASARLVLAVGAGATALLDRAPELARLQPIKGQIAVAPQGPRTGPVRRWPGGYLAPGPDGARIGATMEPGRSDTAVEPEVIERLGQTARRYVADLDLTGLRGAAGVRMATPDGLPLVGRSTAGPVLAIGARRNGWLLAPLVGAMAAAYVTDQEPGPWARLMDPQRFEGA